MSTPTHTKKEKFIIKKAEKSKNKIRDIKVITKIGYERRSEAHECKYKRDDLTQEQ